MESYLTTFSQREELLRQLEKEEEIKRQQERESLIRDIVTATNSKQPQTSTSASNELLAKISQLEKELAATKAQNDLYLKDRPQISELISEKQTKEEAQKAFAIMFAQKRLRSNPTASTDVSLLNLALETSGEKYGVRFGYHDHSRALKAAGLPEPTRSNSRYFYSGVELLPETKSSPVSLSSLPQINQGSSSPVMSPQVNLSPPGTPTPSPSPVMASPKKY
jgi:hypothetical protein